MMDSISVPKFSLDTLKRRSQAAHIHDTLRASVAAARSTSRIFPQ